MNEFGAEIANVKYLEQLYNEFVETELVKHKRLTKESLREFRNKMNLLTKFLKSTSATWKRFREMALANVNQFIKSITKNNIQCCVLCGGGYAISLYFGIEKLVYIRYVGKRYRVVVNRCQYGAYNKDGSPKVENTPADAQDETPVQDETRANTTEELTPGESWADL